MIMTAQLMTVGGIVLQPFGTSQLLVVVVKMYSDFMLFKGTRQRLVRFF